MKLKRNRHEHAEVETSSLNDIMFFLLLFFLIAATLANPNVVKIQLPNAKNTTSVQTKAIWLTVTKDKRLFIDTDEIPFEKLPDELQKLKNQYQNPDNPQNSLNIVLRLDKDLIVQDMVDVMEVGAALGIKMVLSTEKKGN